MDLLDIDFLEKGQGLCNKLFCLFSACDIAIQNKNKILEPSFGWYTKIRFSDIYDIDVFNKKMKPFNNGENIIIPNHEKHKYNIIHMPNNYLWRHCESISESQRKKNEIDQNCMMIAVLNALTLNKSNMNICKDVKNIEHKNAIHIRTEDDWVSYSMIKDMNKKNNELYLINCDSLIDLYNTKFKYEDVFFTTGQNHSDIQKKMSTKNIHSQFLFDKNLEYEINAAINFELCCKAKRFIGLSRSTFSNLISLKRSLTNHHQSFIYNINNDITLRTDKGLHCDPEKSVNNIVMFLYNNNIKLNI